MRGERLYDDLDDGVAATVPDVKYGTWSRQAGFRRAPIRLPAFNARVREQGDRLLAAVRQHADDLPCTLVDRFALWLLNATTGMPLALIASACDDAACDRPGAPRWTPGQHCLAERPEARRMQDLVTELAGDRRLARWFERRRDGRGAAVDDTAGPVEARMRRAR